MKKETTRIIKTKTADFLEMLYYSLDDFGTVVVNKKEMYRYVYGQGGGRATNEDLSKSLIGKWINALRGRGYIQVKKSPDRQSIEFTNKGKLKIVESIASRIDKDRTYRFVSFDIPEDRRLNRNRFRAAIKNIGFTQIQQSLWVIDKDVADFVQMAAYEYGVEKYTVYVVSAGSDIDGAIEKKINKQKSQQ